MVVGVPTYYSYIRTRDKSANNILCVADESRYYILYIYVAAADISSSAAEKKNWFFERCNFSTVIYYTRFKNDMNDCELTARKVFDLKTLIPSSQQLVRVKLLIFLVKNSA